MRDFLTLTFDRLTSNSCHTRLRSLRSAERRVCSVPRQNSTFGDRSFAAAGPRAWNELPFNLRDTALSLTVFNAHLKTHLFSISCGATGPRRICDIYDFFAPHINVLTYLLTYLQIVLQLRRSSYPSARPMRKHSQQSTAAAAR